AAPVQFHEVRPWGDTVVAPEAEALVPVHARIRFLRIELGPAADAGTDAIRAHHPPRTHQFPSHQRALRMNTRDRCLPSQLHAARGRVMQQDLMKASAPDS